MSDVFCGVNMQKIDTWANVYNKIDTSKITEPGKQNQLKYGKNAEAFEDSNFLDSDNNSVDTKYEYVFYLLKATDMSIADDYETRTAIEGLSDVERALETFFILSNLKRMYPERRAGALSMYQRRINNIVEDNGFTKDCLKDYIEKRTIAELKKQTENNKYFTYTLNGTPSTSSGQINPKMNFLLQYLLADDKSRPSKKRALVNMAQNMAIAVRKSGGAGSGSYVDNEDTEFGTLLNNYPDISSFIAEATNNLYTANNK